MAGQTWSETMMFAWQLTPLLTTWPANGMQSVPVWAAAWPRASMIATCRLAAAGSSASSWASASGALVPAARSSRARGPYETSALAWVATAPTPGAAQGTIGPTENQWDWTATPS